MSSSKRRGLPTAVRMKHDHHFVDELVTRHGEPVGKRVLLSDLEPDRNQPRSAMGELEGLAQSVRDKGILEPILVRPIDSSQRAEGSTAQFRIISGERRYHAAREAGLLEVPVIEMDVEEDEALEIALVENLQRKDLTPFEEAEGYGSLQKLHGYTHEDIAKAVGKSRTVVTEALSLLQLSAQVRGVADALGIHSKTVLREVAKLDGEEAQIEMLEQVASHGLSRDDLRAQNRASNKSGRATDNRPYIFRFKAPDKSYSLALTFRTEEVDRGDLIGALEKILVDLRSEEDADSGAS